MILIDYLDNYRAANHIQNNYSIINNSLNNIEHLANVNKIESYKIGDLMEDKRAISKTLNWK